MDLDEVETYMEKDEKSWTESKLRTGSVRYGIFGESDAG